MPERVTGSRMMSSRERNLKLLTLALASALTVAIHYGWVLEFLFGHSAWVHAVHSRFCYIPIAIAAAWFGLRGGVLAATFISLLIIPFLLGAGGHGVNLSQEFVEIFFYFAIGTLIGALIDRDRRIRQKQLETERQLERSEHLSTLGQMAAGVAHEIKNPLASIKGALEILSDPSVPEEEKAEFREIAAGEIRRIDGTVRDFLEFGRPREMRKESVELGALVGAAVKQLNPQAEGMGVMVRLEPDERLVVKADREQMHQVILNLVLNGLEASTRGGEIVVGITRGADGMARLTVTDNGKGMTPDQAERIFEPFFTTKGSGTGLGLSIVKGIVEKHGGRIGCASRVGAGTTMTIELPAEGGAR
jgi:two-component system, NtrC family, sensor histidine kinase HydH